MQRKPFACAGGAAMACALLLGCATVLTGTTVPVSINSSPGSAKVEVKMMDGTIVEQGMTPMTATLGKDQEYTVTISLDGYQPQTIPILRSGFEPAACCNLPFLAPGLLGLAADHSSGAMYKLEPSSINVMLKQVTAQGGEGSVIYAFLTVVDEGGTQYHGAVEMTAIVPE